MYIHVNAHIYEYLHIHIFNIHIITTIRVWVVLHTFIHQLRTADVGCNPPHFSHDLSVISPLQRTPVISADFDHRFKALWRTTSRMPWPWIVQGEWSRRRSACGCRAWQLGDLWSGNGGMNVTLGWNNAISPLKMVYTTDLWWFGGKRKWDEWY